MKSLGVSFFCLALFLEAATGNNCSRKTANVKEECSQRYDIVTGLASDVFYKIPCEAWYNLQYCICNSDLTIWYSNLPPYVFTLPDGTLDGIIPAIFKLALRACCKNCTRISYQKPFKSLFGLSLQFYNTSYYQILMPAIAMKDARSYFGNPYVRLIDSPGVIFIQQDNKGDVMMNKLLKSIMSTWPLFALIMLLTVQGGVIIWLLDTRSNPDEFPPSFIRGSLEGGWWAYISMTTVGYGDKSPRSFGGRIFAIFWITIGIAISGIFTASISSTLTSAAIGEKTNIDGKNVGYLKQIATGYEENIIYREGATAVGYWNIADLIATLQNGTIEGILMDRFSLRYHWRHFKDSGMKFDIRKDIQNSDTAFGITFAGKKYEHWAHFIRTFIEENKDAESRLLTDAIKEMAWKLPEESQEMTKVGTNDLGSNTVYTKMLMIMAISCSITVSIGLIVTLAQKLYTAKIIRKRSVKDTELSVFNNGTTADRFDHFSKAVEENVLENLRNQISSLRQDIMNRQKNIRL